MKRLEESAVESTFAALEPKRQRSILNRLTIVTHGIQEGTIALIEDEKLRHFAQYMFGLFHAIGGSSLKDLEVFHLKYLAIKETITGGYFYQHYYASGPNTYLFNKLSATGERSPPFKNDVFVYRHSNSEHSDAETAEIISKEEFFALVEKRLFLSRTVVGGPNVHLDPDSISKSIDCINIRQLMLA